MVVHTDNNTCAERMHVQKKSLMWKTLFKKNTDYLKKESYLKKIITEKKIFE